MKYSRKNVMKNAWAIRKSNNVSMSTALKAAYFGRLSRDEIEVLAKALRATGTLRLGDDMEYSGSTIVYVWERATADR